jgi:hypothetical protein
MQSQPTLRTPLKRSLERDNNGGHEGRTCVASFDNRSAVVEREQEAPECDSTYIITTTAGGFLLILDLTVSRTQKGV